MTNEIMRILRNCNEFCLWDEVTQHVSYFMKRLQFSGYDQDFRYEVTKKALRKHKLKQQKGTTDTDEQQRQTSQKRKWFQRSDGADAVMFVPATKNGELKEEVQRCAKRNKMNIKSRKSTKASPENYRRVTPSKKRYVATRNARYVS